MADEIRALIREDVGVSAREAGPVVDISAPRRELAELLEGEHRDERLATSF